jgi:hypothetical protein
MAFTPSGTLEELRSMVKDAVDCYFDEAMEAPELIRLHFVRDEVLFAVKLPRDVDGRQLVRALRLG